TGFEDVEVESEESPVVSGDEMLGDQPDLENPSPALQGS
ncbi:MAG: hypothetical protein H6Q38_2294, partial [Chloroflexi bacterium]|nr:hypothetical protein [Chloroflexota bacterium]